MARGSGTGSPSTCSWTGRPARPTSSSSESRPSSPGWGASSTPSPSSRIAPSSRRISVSAVRPACSTARERVAVLAERVGQPVPHGADLEHHHADGVGDDVVQLAGDARALLGDGDAGGGGALPLGLGRPRLRRFGLLRSLAHRKSGEPAETEQQRDEYQLAGRVGGLVVDHDRRAADDDPQAQPCMHRVAQVPEQERGRHPERGRRW